MKKGWKLEKLGDVCEIIMGQSPNGKSYNSIGKGVPLINGPVEFSNGSFGETIRSKFTTQPTKLCKEGDLILCVRGSTTGRMNIAGFDACIGRGVAAIRAKQFQPWINHFVSSKRNEIHGKGTGATFPNVSGTMLANFELLMPPLPEQQRIVAILNEAFEAIAAARANAEQNRQNARALFESYLQSVFSQPGDGWRDSGNVLSSMCELIVDCEHKTAPTQDEGFPSIRTPNIGKGKLLLDNVKRVSEETYLAWTRRAVPLPGDLIFAREAPAGNVAVVPDGLQPCLGQRTVLIRPKKESFDSLFLTYLLLSPSMQEHLLSHSKGATVQHINMKDIRALRLGCIPPIREQRELARRITDCSMYFERLESLYQRKIAALDELKQSLLQQAFSGQL
ncbi:restriction endonuclease subunit S [Aeromonas enteropelogenes]|uniref:restriction endonuclease subunit S n=1 Tax=Aeromonas enteropelogenes TaxID=29489 RepID=UPI003BA13895